MPHATTMPSSGFQALILCGPGVSLNTFTAYPEEFPKALIPIANRPMVWYPLDWCYRMGVASTYILVLSFPPSVLLSLLRYVSHSFCMSIASYLGQFPEHCPYYGSPLRLAGGFSHSSSKGSRRSMYPSTVQSHVIEYLWLWLIRTKKFISLHHQLLPKHWKLLYPKTRT